MHRRKNTPAKKRILLSLWIITTIIKIKAETITKITEIATKTTKTLAVIKYTNNQMLTENPRDVTISARKKIAVHGDIQRRNIIRLRRSTKATSIIKPKDGLITISRNALNSILLTIKETIVMT